MAELAASEALAGGMAEVETGAAMAEMARGGIAMGPTHALVGEGGEPELVAPLSKLPTLMANMSNIGGDTHITINVSGGMDDRTANMVASRVADVVEHKDVSFRASSARVASRALPKPA